VKRSSLSLSDGKVELNSIEGVVDWRNRLMPATVNQSFPEVPTYPQVFADRHGFLPNLSILDYLFCAGNKL